VKSVRLPKSLNGLVPLAMHIIRRNEKTKKTKTYSRALHRYCPIPIATPTKQPSAASATTKPVEPVIQVKQEQPDIWYVLLYYIILLFIIIIVIILLLFNHYPYYS
jgi:hypothetical protein